MLIPGIIGPAIGVAVLKNAEQVVGDDGTLSFVPNQNIFIAALIATAFLAVFLIVIFAVMKRMEVKNEK